MRGEGKNGNLTQDEVEAMWWGECCPEGLCDKRGFEAPWEAVNELRDTGGDEESSDSEPDADDNEESSDSAGATGEDDGSPDSEEDTGDDDGSPDDGSPDDDF